MQHIDRHERERLNDRSTIVMQQLDHSPHDDKYSVRAGWQKRLRERYHSWLTRLRHWIAQ